MRAPEADVPFPYEAADIETDVQAVLRRWRVLAACTLLAVVLAVASMFLRSTRYEAEAELLVTPVRSDTTFDDTTSNLALLRDPGGTVFTAARAVGRPQVIDTVIRRLELDYTREQLRGMVTIQPVQQSGIVSITVRAPTAPMAAEIANTFAEVTVEQRTAAFQGAVGAEIERIEARLAELEPVASGTESLRALSERLVSLRSLVGSNDPTVALWTPAVAPDAATSLPMIIIVLAGVVGLLVGIALALVLDRLDRRVRSDTTDLDGLPLLGRSPTLPAGLAAAHLARPLERELPADFWESFRVLRTNLDAKAKDGAAPFTVLVTSGGREDGKTMTAVNLALTFAARGTDVVLLDGDLRRQSIARAFDLADEGQLGELLAGRLSVTRTVARPLDDAPGLAVIAAGTDARTLVDAMEPAAVERARDAIGTIADVLIIDSPPAVEAADALVWAAIADVAIVAVRERHTRVADVEEAVRSLAARAIPLIGYFLTSATTARGPLEPGPRCHADRPTSSGAHHRH